MKVICDQASICDWHLEDKAKGFGCGGAKPHYPDSECNNCPINPEAKCIPISNEVEYDNREQTNEF